MFVRSWLALAFLYLSKMRVCLFASADLSCCAALRPYSNKISYLAYMSRGVTEGADACIKTFALDSGIQSCPFICVSFEELTGMGALFDSCIILRRNDDDALAKIALALTYVFSNVEEICYNPVIATPDLLQKKTVRKLSTIAEE